MFNELLFVFTFYFAAIGMTLAFVWAMYDAAKTRRWWKEMEMTNEEA